MLIITVIIRFTAVLFHHLKNNNDHFYGKRIAISIMMKKCAKNLFEEFMYFSVTAPSTRVVGKR